MENESASSASPEEAAGAKTLDPAQLIEERCTQLAQAVHDALDLARFQSRDSLFVTADELAAYEVVPDWMDATAFSLWLAQAKEGVVEPPASKPKAAEEMATGLAAELVTVQPAVEMLAADGGNDASAAAAEVGIAPAAPTLEEIEYAAFCELPEDALADLGVKEGKERRYFYSHEMMSDAYAQWLFLSEEGDDMATFLYCVRQESKLYPRPLKAASLGNPPFLLSQQRAEELYAAAVAGGECADIGRTEASNGDVYYFSSDYLTPSYAGYLAEWYSVGYLENP